MAGRQFVEMGKLVVESFESPSSILFSTLAGPAALSVDHDICMSYARAIVIKKQLQQV